MQVIAIQVLQQYRYSNAGIKITGNCNTGSDIAGNGNASNSNTGIAIQVL